MANRYGEAALMAVRMETYGKALTPAERWQDAVGKLYPTTPSAQRKGGPRMTFLGLCEAGLVAGIPAGQYSPSNKNKVYALQAVDLLRARTHTTVTQLWEAVTDGEQVSAQQPDGRSAGALEERLDRSVLSSRHGTITHSSQRNCDEWALGYLKPG